MAKLRQVMYNLDVGNQVDIEIRRDGRVFTKNCAVKGNYVKLKLSLASSPKESFS